MRVASGCQPSIDAGVWRARDNHELPFKTWQNRAGNVRSILLLVHGLNGSVDDFEPLVEALADGGVACFAAGLRGQGADPCVRTRGDLRCWGKLRDDLLDFAGWVRGQTGPALPTFVFGESMGALVALQAAIAAPFAGVVLSSPVVKFRHEPNLSGWQRLLIQALFRCAPWWRPDLRSIGGKGSAEPVVTRDELYLARIRNAPYRIRRFTLGFYRELIALVAAAPTAARQLNGPVLVLAAGEDVFVTAEDVTSFFSVLPAADKTLQIYPDRYHLLVRDWGAEQVIADVQAWLHARSGEAEPTKHS